MTKREERGEEREEREKECVFRFSSFVFVLCV
jgi:hypothetical protein